MAGSDFEPIVLRGFESLFDRGLGFGGEGGIDGRLRRPPSGLAAPRLVALPTRRRAARAACWTRVEPGV